MRALMSLIGIIVIFLGALPYLLTLDFLSFLAVIPATGPVYQGIIIAIGALTLFLGFKLKRS